MDRRLTGVGAVLAAGLVVAGPGAAAAEGIVLAENGRTEYRIVVPAAPSPPVRYAAEELGRWLGQVAGTTFAVVPDTEPPGPHEIVLGGTNARLAALNLALDVPGLGAEGYVLRTAGPHLVIAGGEPRGTLYGVYGLLEDHLGCRWFTPTVSHIPSQPRLVLAALDQRRVPALEYREPFVKDCFDGDWCARNRVNSSHGTLEERHGGKVTYVGFVHTFDQLVPPGTYFAQHPEYFAEVNGKRIGTTTQLCCTNEDVIRLVTEEIRRRMREHPEALVFSVSQNDWGNYCQCAACRELAGREEAQAAPVLHLVNRVAEALEKEFPRQAIDTLAYQWSRKPPKTLRPRPNVIVRLCSIECCFSHPLASCDNPANRAFRADIEGWSRVCDRLWIWDYTTSFANYLVPFPNLRVLDENIRFFVQNHVTGIFEEDNYTSLSGELSPLAGYLMAKFLWDPAYDRETALTEFLEHVYGPAARPLHTYLDLLHDKVARENIHMHIWEGPGAPYLTDDLLREADRLWDEAEAAVADQPELLDRVRIARLSPDWVMLERTRSAARGPFVLRNGRYEADTDPAFVRRAERFFAAAAKGDLTALREGASPLADYRAQVERKFGSFDVVSLDNGTLGVDLVPGLGGRLLGLRLLTTGQNLCSCGTPGDPGYPAAGGYAEGWQAGAQGPGWGDRFTCTRTAAPDGQAADLACDIPDGVHLRRLVRLPRQGASLEIASTVSNPRPGPLSGDLRAAFSFALGPTDAITLVRLGANGEAVSLSLPEQEAQRDLSFTGAQVAEGVVLASHAAGLGVRLLPYAPNLERAWVRVDARRAVVTWEVLARAALEPNAATAVRHQVEVLRDLSAVPQATHQRPAAHRALRVVAQDDQVGLGHYGEWCWIEPASGAEDGFAVRLNNNHIEWCVQWRYAPTQFEPNTRYDVYARIRVQKAGNDGQAFWAGVYDTVHAADLGLVGPRLADVADSEWHTYKLATVTPAEGHYVWIGPQNNAANAPGLWLDSFELRAVPAQP